MARYSEKELARLLNTTSHEAAYAREAGDMEEYERLVALNELLFKVYRGAGTLKDDLEIEKQLRGPLQGIAQAGKWVAIAVGALILLPYVQRAQK